MTFSVAIIGRPNVGKSTLFNRLVGKRLALVDDTPGVTRDWREGEGRIASLRFRVLDTAGLEDAPDDSLAGRMRRQTEQALRAADVALFLLDARAGVTPVDEHFADLLRKESVPVILVANKCEGKAGEPGLLEAYALGLGDPVPVSAEHGEGMGDLFEALLPHADEAESRDALIAGEVEELADGVVPDDEEEDDRGPLQLAIVGRPNVGKSTLINRLLGEERLLTGPEAGITRDSIAVDWSFQGRPVKLVDTAGLRRRARVNEKLEKLSGSDTMRAIRFAQVVVVMLDAELMLEKQDLTIARQVVEEGRGLIIAANKWDIVKNPKQTLKALQEKLEITLPQVRGVPVVTISALEGRNLDRLLGTVFDLYDLWRSRISTAKLNDWLNAMTTAHPPPMVAGRRIRLRYATQVKTRPPTFAIWCSRGNELPDSYTRYLVNGLREDFDLEGVPLRVLLRKSENPYADRAKKRR
ncbi:MAG: ribosome biogenesis GTPase Der [Proteobacteria bacterium]|nr:ribosome biogenesis GTPase Der [Pseudomonadota bacterium]